MQSPSSLSPWSEESGGTILCVTLHPYCVFPYVIYLVFQQKLHMAYIPLFVLKLTRCMPLSCLQVRRQAWQLGIYSAFLVWVEWLAEQGLKSS